jgi:hypothetical protein
MSIKLKDWDLRVMILRDGFFFKEWLGFSKLDKRLNSEGLVRSEDFDS